MQIVVFLVMALIGIMATVFGGVLIINYIASRVIDNLDEQLKG